jgi:hypothetical protein
MKRFFPFRGRFRSQAVLLVRGDVLETSALPLRCLRGPKMVYFPFGVWGLLKKQKAT